jgi:hypothetical protein
MVQARAGMYPVRNRRMRSLRRNWVQGVSNAPALGPSHSPRSDQPEGCSGTGSTSQSQTVLGASSSASESEHAWDDCAAAKHLDGRPTCTGWTITVPYTTTLWHSQELRNRGETASCD